MPDVTTFRSAIEADQPLQVVGTVNAYCAMMAEQAGFKALYVSGAGVANASMGLPDLGLTLMHDLAIDVRRIAQATQLPILVDIDTGFESECGIAETIRAMIEAGASAVHLEDQVAAKRCGHRDGKKLVDTQTMQERIRQAVNARDALDTEFTIMARTDALACEGVDQAIARAQAYCQAGADMIFAEALEDLSEYRRFTASIDAPILANMTEFGKTPLYSVAELADAGVSMVLYPLSAFRAMNQAAQRVYQAIHSDGTQRALLDTMQTRDELYDILDYQRFEAAQRK